MTVSELETKVRGVFTDRTKAEIGTPTLVEAFSIILNFANICFQLYVQASALPGVDRQHGLEPLGVAGHCAAPPSDVALQHRHQRQHGLGRQPPHRVVNKLKYCV